MKPGERKGCFHGHHKTKATAGNCASTFRQQPFVFPSASHPVGGILPPCPWKESRFVRKRSYVPASAEASRLAGIAASRWYCCITQPGASAAYAGQGPLRPRTPAPEDFIHWTLRRASAAPHPAPGALPLDPVCDVCWVWKSRFFRMRLGERKNCFHGHNENIKNGERESSCFLLRPFFCFPGCKASVRRHSAAVPVCRQS